MIQWMLTEAVSQAPLGTVVQWRTPTGLNLGIVIGTEGKELIAVTMIDKTLDQEVGEKLYRDDALSDRLGSLRGMPRVHIDVHRVPKNKASLVNRLKGMELKPYVRLARELHKPQKAHESVVGGDQGEVVYELEQIFNG